MILALALTAAPLAVVAVPVKYPDQLASEYPALALAVPLTLSPYLTVKVPLDPPLTTTLLLVWVIVSAVTLPLAPAITVIVYSFLLYQQPNVAFALTVVVVAAAVNGEALVVLGAPNL